MSDTTIKYQSISDVYRDLILFFKIDGGIPFALSDFPSIAEGRWQYFRDNWDFIKQKYLGIINGLPPSEVKSKLQLQHKNFGELIQQNIVSPQNPLSNKATFKQFVDLFGVILVNDLEATINELNIINSEVQRVTLLKRDDFLQMRERVRIVHDKTADSMGLSDVDYNNLYDRVSAPQIFTFRFENFPILSSLIALGNQITTLIPDSIVEVAEPDPFEVIRRALNNGDIPMNSSSTGFVVPFPAGSSLEQVAKKYLGDPDRALELATANGLQFPYVDETGQKIPLLLNGIGNTILVPLAESNRFALNQEVFVGSDGKKSTRRTVTKLELDQNNSSLLITVDGPANLSDYTSTQRAYVLVYALNTVNSSKFIMIPTQDELGFQVNAQAPWFTKNLSPDLKQAGVDLALSVDNDLVFDNLGDLQVVYGIANLAQALNLKVLIKVNDLLRNPEFGITEIVGTIRNNEVTQSLLTTLIENALAGDTRFSGTDGIGYTVTENAIFVNATIRLAGSDASIPLSFQLPKGS
jgi:hypothetical protein